MLNQYRIDRFAAKIETLEAFPAETGRVLMYGSSFFTHWGYERMRQQLSDATDGKLQVVNHGFGGSRVPELLYYYHRLVTPCRPSAFVLRTGVNDLYGGVSPEECMHHTEQLVSWLRCDYPDAPIIFVEIFDIKKATDRDLALFAEYNTLLRACAAEHEKIFTVDLNPFFHENEEDYGTIRNLKDVFVEDGLHLTDEAYAEMAKFFAPIIYQITKGL